jgi:hypothetical protein
MESGKKDKAETQRGAEIRGELCVEKDNLKIAPGQAGAQPFEAQGEHAAPLQGSRGV